MAHDELDDLTVVPLPSGETEEEHKRIRSSNDRDQQREREGKPSRHNQGYDEAADGKGMPKVERVVDE
jgi:hypothetical protein